MIWLMVILHLFIGSTLAGSLVIAALAFGFGTLTPILITAAAGFVGLALWRGLPGWWLRALGLGLLVLSLAGPQLREEARQRPSIFHCPPR